MSKGHASYSDEVRVSYDALGVYVLKHPPGTRFRSFREVFAAFDLSFDDRRERISFSEKNLKPSTVLLSDGRSFVRHQHFHGEIRFFDVCGLHISFRDVAANLARCRRERSMERKADVFSRRWRWDPATFRRGPVPMTGYRGGRGGGFKGPAVFREQSDMDFMRFDEDCLERGLRPRGWRRAYLPDDLWWDNWHRDQGEDRSWKRHRRRQWKD
jgi:hypothetical protein